MCLVLQCLCVWGLSDKLPSQHVDDTSIVIGCPNNGEQFNKCAAQG